MFKRNKPEFLRRYVSMDDTWLHHFTPKINRQSAEWTAHDETAPKRGKIQQSSGKVMAFVFWDTLKKKRLSAATIKLSDHLKVKIVEKRPHLKKKKVLFHQDHAPYYNSVKTTAKIQELSFESGLYPPYSPGLIPSDYVFVLRSHMTEKTENYFEAKNESYDKNGIEKLEGRYSQCISLEGNFVE
ncbi:histone-lysine N-methyltransferase SETMAR-like [Bactrocera neohumeralis]|uniref:histone-lysine N-methyltransferase SETMAR-like n=1 Tax=Bactrocera neohumeralis TaxID=98809 RepID=UPI0021659D27|nr:histone-lysine N-methyltransferase SETMAR-like [Bactrocera neohumeralis]